MKSFAAKLELLMKEKNLSQADLAMNLRRVSEKTVGCWLSGERQPSPAQMAALARYSGFPTEYWTDPEIENPADAEEDEESRSTRFPGKLRELMWKRGDISASQLAKHGVGVKQNTISRWLKGERTPTIRQLVGLARILDVPLAYLADDEIERPEDVRGEVGLSAQERELLEQGRRLGVERAARLLWITAELGDWQEIFHRVMGPMGTGNPKG